MGSNSLTREAWEWAGFPGGSDRKESAFSAGDLGLVPASGGSSGGGNGFPLQYSCLENPMDKNLVGYSPWGLRELDTTKQLSMWESATLNLPPLFIILHHICFGQVTLECYIGGCKNLTPLPSASEIHEYSPPYHPTHKWLFSWFCHQLVKQKLQLQMCDQW